MSTSWITNNNQNIFINLVFHLKHLRVISVSACFTDKLAVRMSLINV